MEARRPISLKKSYTRVKVVIMIIANQHVQWSFQVSRAVATNLQNKNIMVLGIVEDKPIIMNFFMHAYNMTSMQVGAL